MNNDDELNASKRNTKIYRSPEKSRIATRSVTERLKSTSDTQKIDTPKTNTSHQGKANPSLPLSSTTTQRIIKNQSEETEEINPEVQKSKPGQESSTSTQTAQLEPRDQETPAKTNTTTQTKHEEKLIQETIHNKKANKNIIMNQKEIQRSIATFVPEFSGRDTEQRDNELSRFFGTAGSIREMLTSEAEKEIFDRLIKFRLTGDAYIRMMHKDVKDYATFKETLENMYRRTQTLDELENKITTIQQSYGETIRNYGYRLMEALDKYRKGYKAKYNLGKIDETYDKHLDASAVRQFKKGINNTILREKVATIKADTVELMIKEVELTERMLELTTNTYKTNYQPQQQGTYQQIAQSNQILPIICNYCQKANHTWDVCRTRLFKESINNKPETFNRNTQQTRAQYNNQQYNQYNTNRPSFRTNEWQPQGSYNAQNNYGRQLHRFPSNQQQTFQPKYCSFCKITKGHTFEECRSKLLPNRNNMQNNYPNANNNNYRFPTNNNRNYQTNTNYNNQNMTNPNRTNGNPGTGRYVPTTSYNNTDGTQPMNTQNPREQYGNPKVNMLTPQQQQNYELNQDQGNDNGSNQP